MRLLMKQAQKMQEKMQKEIAELQVEGTAGGGMVTIRMTGNHAVASVSIKPEAVASNDAEMLEDLVLAALNDAHRQIEAALQEKMGSLKIPGFGL
ncbi:MAG TPA: YbaB/EbfC family nucleoid-associated protein [Candidatus Polarisedimenticolia bacterium]|nr:YbaB/EbfC family nucleoid-associated protein [Candidatus Polarisedimenticolia bacterium]